jgi:ABC-type glycerol-3-phosphate transport system permease component
MAAMVLPFVWMFSVSVGRPSDVFVVPPRWIPGTLQFGNYRRVLLELPFLSWFLNSFKIASLVTVGQLFTCSTAAYAFARLRFPGRNVLFLVLLSALMIPIQVTIIPIFIIMRVLNLLDNHLALILPPLMSAFGVFLLRQFFLTIPRELEDAARIDGAGPLMTFSRIILPLSGGALATLAVLTYNFFWNDYFAPLIFINSPPKMTLPLGIGIMAGRYVEAGGMGADAAGIVAAVAMSIVPVLLIFLFAQRYLIESITMTGLKA